MATRRTTRRGESQPERRRSHRRVSSYGRRTSDAWKEFGKTAGLVASMTGAVLGQAELVGEPWRHYIAVVFIASTGAFAFLMGPQSLRIMKSHLRRIGQ